MKVLVAEDHPEISLAIREGLEAEGFSVHVVRDGARVVQTAENLSFAVLILDVMLPNCNGFEIVRELRSKRNNIPVIMVTARDGIGDRVMGLDAGADDYLVKPFHFKELVARIRALVRRDSVVRSAVIEIEDLVINIPEKRVMRANKELVLTPREFSLLVALAQNEGRVLSKETILSKVWFDEYGMPNTVEVHLKNLRRKVDAEPLKKLIQTSRGSGYCLRVQP